MNWLEENVDRIQVEPVRPAGKWRYSVFSHGERIIRDATLREAVDAGIESDTKSPVNP